MVFRTSALLVLLLVTAPLSRAQDPSLGFLQEAAAAMKAEQFQQALGFYRQAMVAAPGDWRGFQGAGNACTRLEDYPCAVESYQKALALKPEGDAKLASRIVELKALIPSPPETELPPPPAPTPAVQEAEETEEAETPPPAAVPAQTRASRSRSKIGAWFRLGTQWRLSPEFEVSAETRVNQYEQPGAFYPGNTAEYKVSTARSGITFSMDLGYKASETWVLGLRAGYQSMPDAYLDHSSETDGFSTLTADDSLSLSVVSFGFLIQARKPGPSWTFYGSVTPGLYQARIQEDQKVYIDYDYLRYIGDVQGTGFGAAFQAGVERRVGSRVALFAEFGFETASIGSLTGSWALSGTLYPADSGRGVWVLIPSAQGDAYTIYDLESLDNTTQEAGLGLSSLRLDFGIRGGW